MTGLRRSAASRRCEDLGAARQNGPLPGAAAGPDAKRVSSPRSPTSSVRAIRLLGRTHAADLRVGADGAFVLGRGQLDTGDAGSVGLGEMNGVVAGSGSDVQDAAAGDVTEQFCPRPDPFPGRPAEPVGDGWGTGAGQLAPAVDLPGAVLVSSAVTVASWVGAGGQMCVMRYAGASPRRARSTASRRAKARGAISSCQVAMS